MTNLATVNQSVSQSALALADNMSRVGAQSALSTVQIREFRHQRQLHRADQADKHSESTSNGRVILSSLEQNASGGQWIHWQRCIGTKNVASAYGPQGTGATGTSFAGHGFGISSDHARRAQPMFVEIVYDYPALFGTMFIPARTIRYEVSFVVRDDRDLAGPTGGDGVYNPEPSSDILYVQQVHKPLRSTIAGAPDGRHDPRHINDRKFFGDLRHMAGAHPHRIPVQREHQGHQTHLPCRSR